MCGTIVVSTITLGYRPCPPKVLIPNVMVWEGEVFGRWLGRAGGDGICALLEAPPRRSLAPSATWGQGEKIVLVEPGSGSPPDTGSARALILSLPESRTVRWEKDVCHLSHPECSIFSLVAWTKTLWFRLCLDTILKSFVFCSFVVAVLSPCVIVTEHRASDASRMLADVCGLLMSPRRAPWSGCELRDGPWTGSQTTPRSVPRRRRKLPFSFGVRIEIRFDFSWSRIYFV